MKEDPRITGFQTGAKSIFNTDHMDVFFDLFSMTSEDPPPKKNAWELDE